MTNETAVRLTEFADSITKSMLDTFIDLAPFIIGVVGLVIGVNLVKWGVTKVQQHLFMRDYLSGRYTGDDEDIDYNVEDGNDYR